MTAPESKECEGTLDQLAHAVFSGAADPGYFKIFGDEAPSEVTDLFNLLCELYIMGAKIHNGVIIADQLPALDKLRSDTTTFLRERMTTAFGVVPTLGPAPEPPDPASPAQYKQCIRSKLEDCWLVNLRLGTRLSFTFAR